MKTSAHTAKMQTAVRRNAGHHRLGCLLALFVLLTAAPAAHAAGGEEKEYDSYKLRFDLFWFYSLPSGQFTSKAFSGFVDLQKDIGFNSYSTFYGKVDWRFTRKNHLYFIANDFDQSKTVVLGRTVTFQGQTFAVGAIATGNLESLIFTPGYQYDFIRRKRGHLGVQVQVNIIDVTGRLSAAAQVVNGVPHAATFSSGNLRVPLPVAGPEGRFYLIPNSGRLFVDANILGMYFFGYGNYISSQGTLGLTLTRNLAVRGGYQLASRLDVNTRTQRLGVTLSQKGALAGLEISF